MSFARTDMRFNVFQWGVINGLGWLAVLTDGWITHTHYLAVAGYFLLIYSMWKMMKTAEDEEFDRIEREQAHGWRKRQIEEVNQAFDEQYEIHKRNEVLEEVAQEFEKMPFGDTAASFAIFVRGMKK